MHTVVHERILVHVYASMCMCSMCKDCVCVCVHTVVPECILVHVYASMCMCRKCKDCVCVCVCVCTVSVCA